MAIFQRGYVESQLSHLVREPARYEDDQIRLELAALALGKHQALDEALFPPQARSRRRIRFENVSDRVGSIDAIHRASLIAVGIDAPSRRLAGGANPD